MKISILSRYLFKEIVHYFLLFVLAFIAIMLVNEVYDTRDPILKKQPAATDVILFLILSLPEQVSDFLPLVGLLGTMMAYGLLAKNREILAMIAAGISFRRLAIPAVTFGILLSIGAFWFKETLVPVATSHARYLEKVKIAGDSEEQYSRRTKLFVKGVGNRFYYIQEYRAEDKMMVYPTILQLSDDGRGVRERTDARLARVIPGQDDPNFWEMIGAERWQFNPDGSLASHTKFAAPISIDMEANLSQFLGKNKNPKEMNYAELNEYVGMLKERGGEVTSRFSTPMYQRLAFPLVCLVMTLLGFAAVIDLHARHFARGTFMGLLIAIGYLLLESVLVSLGQGGHISPFIAAWGALFVFIAIVLVMIRRLEFLGH